MILVRRFSQEEALKIIAKYALEDIPEEKNGTVDIRVKKDGSVEIYFLEEVKSDSRTN